MGRDVCYTNHAEADQDSFHDALYLREVLGLRPAPEFEAWLQAMRIMDDRSRLLPPRAGILQLAEGVAAGQ